MDIQNKMAKGAMWLFLEKGAQQIASFIVFAVIIRMIGPEEYGLVALCTIILALTNNISLGLVDSIVSMKIRDDERLSSLFWLVSGVGAFLSLSTFLFADVFAALFEQDDLAPLMQVFACIPLLYALSAVPNALIIAIMDFKIFTIRTLFASLLSGVVGIYFAYDGWGAFALAFQQITVQCVTIVILFISHPWRPRLIFKFGALKETLGLGIGQTSSLVVSFIEQQMPRIILGYFLGAASVGHYAFVRRIIGVIQDGLIQPVLNVVYPAVSEVIDNQENKKSIVNHTVFVIGVIIFPIVSGIFLTSPVFIPLLFGDEWKDSVILLQILIPFLVFISFNLLIRNILRAYRLIRVYLVVQSIIAILATICSIIVVSGGEAAVCAVLLVAAFFSTISLSYILTHYTDISMWRYFRELKSPAMSSILMSLCVWGIVTYINLPDLLLLLMSILSGVITYSVTLFFFERKRLASIGNILLEKKWN